MPGLVLQLALALSPADRLPPPAVVALAQAPRAATLVALQPSSPPLLVPEATSQERALEADLAALNRRIAALNVNWPTGAVIAAYAGGIVVYAALVTGLATLGSLSTPAPLVVLVALGVTGAGLLVAGLVVGLSAAAAAKADRDALILERDQLQRELAELRARPSVVEAPWHAPAPTLTLARF